MKHLEDTVFTGYWLTDNKSELFTLTFGEIERGHFTGLIDDIHGSFPVEGAVSNTFISFKKSEGEIGGKPAFARYQGNLEEEGGRYKISGTWTFSADTRVRGKFMLEQQNNKQ